MERVIVWIASSGVIGRGGVKLGLAKGTIKTLCRNTGNLFVMDKVAVIEDGDAKGAAMQKRDHWRGVVERRYILILQSCA